jgi:hypothetical protein
MAHSDLHSWSLHRCVLTDGARYICFTANFEGVHALDALGHGTRRDLVLHKLVTGTGMSDLPVAVESSN